jgi:ornithine carrier protein
MAVVQGLDPDGIDTILPSLFPRRTPIELVKCKMQVQMLAPASLNQKPPGPLAVLSSVVRTTGLRGLWLGHTGTFIREMGGTAAWFTTKEYVASLLVARRLGSDSARAQDPPTPEGSKPRKPELLLWESAFSGACAGAAFNLAFFPADSVKSMMQTEEELRPPSKDGVLRPKSTFLGTAKAMWRAQGIRGLYAGCGITVARSIPSSAIIFLIYDGLVKQFG